MTPNSRQLIQMIQGCDFRSLSPKALAAVYGIQAYDPAMQERGKTSAALFQVAEERYDAATTLDGKMQWLESLYRMTGVYAGLRQSDCYAEDECDERFDTLLYQYGDSPLAAHPLYERLLCYRMHQSLIEPAPLDPQIRAAFLERCHQWIIDLTGQEPNLWFSLPLTERLYRLWVLSVLHFNARLILDLEHFAPYRWQDVQNCFYRCSQQFRRMEQADVETLTAYYQALCALYPDADGIQEKAYAAYFRRFSQTLDTLRVGSDEWWQLMEVHAHHRKDIAKAYRRSFLPDLSTLDLGSMHDFRLELYQWEGQDSDYFDALQDADIQRLAEETAERLILYLHPVLKNEMELDADTGTAYLLTLLMAVKKMESPDLSARIAEDIFPRLSRLPASRLKTHLQTHLYMMSADETFFHEAYEAATSWPPHTLTNEDTYLLRYLQEEQALVYVA